MRPVDVHRAWAPAGGTWSPWVKPVLFAESDVDEQPHRMPRAPAWLGPMLEPMSKATLYREARALQDTAIVVDLPSEEGTNLGVALTEYGFRPIPLYNALRGPMAIVPVVPIMRVLAGCADHVAKVPASAPPAFLLDANRRGEGAVVRPGLFDNRSLCRPSDFPSSDRLLQAGIRRVLFITEAVSNDLEPIALEWQAAGLALWHKRPSEVEEPARPIELRRSWAGRRLWNFIYEYSFRRRDDGAYGAMIVASGGG